jgi:coenzyme F420 biosynthesis associated uncharacterized protein
VPFSAPEDLDPVSWDVAARVARAALRFASPPAPYSLGALQAEFDAVTERSQALVEESTGLRSSAGPARAVVVDRAGWVTANIGSFQRLLRPVGERLARESRQARRALTPASKAAAGVEVGLLLAWMSGRVLGQYDVFPGAGASGSDALYFVGPNIAALERRHGFSPEEFRLWIALHEMTHRVQFTGVSWMRGYFLDLVERGTSLVVPDAKYLLERLRGAVAELRAGGNPLAEGGVMALLATAEQLETLREAQGLMSLLEGHASVIMTDAAPVLVPDAAHFAAVLAARRTSSAGLTRVVQQALGVEAKLRQYAEGEQFVRAVLAAGGAGLLAEVWSAPSALPGVDEIRAPDRWVARMSPVGALRR